MTTSDIYQYGISLLDQYALLIAIALMALAIVFILLRRSITNAWLNIKTRYRLNHLGLKQLYNFQCPDGLGSYYNIDRLIMRHDGISLLVIKRYPGSIFCADDINEWSQMLAGKSYRFNNPLIELDYQIKAVSAFVPGVQVDGYLFFDHSAQFPKGHPNRVIYLDNIPEALERNKNDKVQPVVESAWKKLGGLR